MCTSIAAATRLRYQGQGSCPGSAPIGGKEPRTSFHLCPSFRSARAVRTKPMPLTDLRMPDALVAPPKETKQPGRDPTLSMVPPLRNLSRAANTPTTLRFQPGGFVISTATDGLHFLVSLCTSFSRLGYSPLHTSHVLMAPNPICISRNSARTAHHIASYRIVTTSKRGKQLSASFS